MYIHESSGSYLIMQSEKALRTRDGMQSAPENNINNMDRSRSTAIHLGIWSVNSVPQNKVGLDFKLKSCV